MLLLLTDVSPLLTTYRGSLATAEAKPALDATGATQGTTDVEQGNLSKPSRQKMDFLAVKAAAHEGAGLVKVQALVGIRAALLGVVIIAAVKTTCSADGLPCKSHLLLWHSKGMVDKPCDSI